MSDEAQRSDDATEQPAIGYDHPTVRVDVEVTADDG